MSSIEDFISHRWADAKEVLRQLDPEFVRRHETTVRLQNMNLWSPVYKNPKDPPQRALSKGWHRLLESSEELCMQVTSVNVAAEGLQSLATDGLSDVEAGILADYHLRSWFAHTLALVERTQRVIEDTAKLYVDNLNEAKRVSDPWKKETREQVGKHVSIQRNDYLHANGSLAGEVTKGKLWEGLVAVGMTPDLFLKEFHYPAEANRVRERFRNVFVPGSSERVASLGQILKGLEQDLARRTDLIYPFSVGKQGSPSSNLAVPTEK